MKRSIAEMIRNKNITIDELLQQVNRKYIVDIDDLTEIFLH